MRFSEAYNITKTESDEWYDCFLMEDTLFFVDPFLIYQSDDDLWRDAHDTLTKFFNDAITLVVQSRMNESSLAWCKAKRMLTFPEPDEVCLGYSEGSAEGGGSGPKGAEMMLSNIKSAIGNGLEEVSHFEELTLFGENIGADRISDITINILKASFILYTQAVCNTKNIALKEFRIRNARFDSINKRWIDERVMLPLNPIREGPVILVPEAFLRDLPKPFLDYRDFWTFAWENFNENLRDDFNFDLSQNVDLSEIIRAARENPDIVESFVEEKIRHPEPSYNMEQDNELLDKWWERGEEIAGGYGVRPPNQQQNFADFIESLVNEYKHSIEQEGSWNLLRNDNGTPRKERASQSLFRSSLKHYCVANNIDLSNEPNAGRGPVDFKFSQGWKDRALIEIKRARNTKFWNGLSAQLPQYLDSEQIQTGIFVVIMESDQDYKNKRGEMISSILAEIQESTKKDIRVVIIDSRPRESASNL